MMQIGTAGSLFVSLVLFPVAINYVIDYTKANAVPTTRLKEDCPDLKQLIYERRLELRKQLKVAMTESETNP
jgi:hypothetical protein